MTAFDTYTARVGYYAKAIHDPTGPEAEALRSQGVTIQEAVEELDRLRAEAYAEWGAWPQRVVLGIDQDAATVRSDGD